MSTTVTDVAHDRSGRLETWVRENFKVPAWADTFAKEAERAPGTRGTYAWPEAQLFPVDTKESTWWSAVSLGRIKDHGDVEPRVIEKVATNLAKAAKFWEISPDDFDPILPVPVIEKEASLDFTLTLQVEDRTLNTVRCTTAEEFEKTASWLVTKGRENYPLDCRLTAARDMLGSEYATALADDLRIELEKTACYGAVSRGRMVNMLDVLSTGLDKVGFTEFHGMLDGARASCPEITTGAELHKTASMLDGVHRALKSLQKPEGTRLPPIEETLNIQTPTMLEKAAQSFVVFPDGRFIKEAEFEEHAPRIMEFVNEVLSKEASLETLRDVVENLTDEESAEFTEALSAFGI